MSVSTDKRAVTFLIVEDDEVDLMAIQRAFKQKRIGNDCVIARDGIEALALLRGENSRPAISRPYIVLLDLNMPRMNGFEFLKAIRGDERLRTSVVFVLTTSNSDEDRARAYLSNIAGFIVKADAGNAFLAAIEMLDHYWRVVELP